MSVFTTVSNAAMEAWLARYSLGSLTVLDGIASGVTNTNYKVTTTQGRYVLTLFETLRASELPYYVNLMAHLAHHGIACASPIANLRDEMIDELCGKPTIIVPWLEGAPIETPTAAQCHALGAMLAHMHKAGATYTGRMSNPRGPVWWNAAAQQLYGFMDHRDAQMLRDEVKLQGHHRFEHLPSGVIHADLFRDNVLMAGDQIGGFIDFYYACNDVLIYDLAITVNDWCALPDGQMHDELAHALCGGYQAVRALDAGEKDAWLLMLRAAALRFWVSRLWDWHKPQSGELTYRKDPTVFQRILAHHAERDRSSCWL